MLDLNLDLLDNANTNKHVNADEASFAIVSKHIANNTSVTSSSTQSPLLSGGTIKKLLEYILRKDLKNCAQIPALIAE